MFLMWTYKNIYPSVKDFPASNYMFKVPNKNNIKKRFYDPDKYPWSKFFTKAVFTDWLFSQKSSVMDVWQGPKYTSIT